MLTWWEWIINNRKKNDIFVNGSTTIAFDKFNDTEKRIMSIVKLEDLLDDIGYGVYCYEFDTYVSIVNPNQTVYIE